MKRGKGLTATFTTDFQHEFHVETGTLLRRRLVWFILLRGGFELMLIALRWLGKLLDWPAFFSGHTINSPLEYAAVNVSFILLYGLTLWYVVQRARRREDLLRLSQWLIFLEGTLWLAGRYVFFGVDSSFVLIQIMAVHIIASLCFPWTAMQAFRPIFGILGLNAVALAVHTAVRDTGSWASAIAEILVSSLIAVPGVIICSVRHSRRLESFRFRHVLDKYGDLRRELTDARRIHEGLFPDPLEDGELRFNYLYQPMRQIGGDFLFASERRNANGELTDLSVVLTDVTGHGIAAALTVNRLHGELERVFAEDPNVDPGRVLSLLNRYVHLTLARHSVYMTAFCLRVKPQEGTLEYASGGHPPAFIKAVNGRVEQLQSTSFVLGACHADDFDPDPRTLRFSTGDAFIAYTDGATEARGTDGRMLGIVGIQRLVAGSGPRYEQSWAEHVLRTVDEFRDGPPADDTLVVELVHMGPRIKRSVKVEDMPKTVRAEL